MRAPTKEGEKYPSQRPQAKTPFSQGETDYSTKPPTVRLSVSSENNLVNLIKTQTGKSSNPEVF